MSTGRAKSAHLDSLVLGVHRCALDPDQWPAVLAQIAALLQADKANLITPQTNTLNVVHGGHENWLEPYHRYYVHQDPWLHGAIDKRAFRSGVIALDDALVEHGAFKRSEFFNDFARKYDLERAVCSCISDGGRGEVAPPTALTLFRAVGQKEFGRDAVEILSKVMPHLQLAIANYARWSTLNARQELARKGLDSVSAAMFALNVEGEVVDTNRSGEQELSRAVYMKLEHCVLRANADCLGARVGNRALHELARIGRGFSQELRAAAGSAVLTGAPIAQSSSRAISAPHGAVALVWLISERASRTPVSVAAKLFHLTPAEQRLLQQLIAGHTLTEASANLSVQPSTARSQLKSIFFKSGRSRQSELLALMHRISMLDL